MGRERKPCILSRLRPSVYPDFPIPIFSKGDDTRYQRTILVTLENVRVGDRVMRSRYWYFLDNHDGGPTGKGTVTHRNNGNVNEK